MLLSNMLLQGRFHQFAVRPWLIAQVTTLLSFVPSCQCATTNTLAVASDGLASSNRLSLAVLAVTCEPGKVTLAPCRSIELQLSIAWLKEVRSLRILPNSSIEFALNQASAAPNLEIAEAQARKLGKMLCAERVVLAGLQREGNRWLLRGYLLTLASQKPPVAFETSSTNVCDVAERFAIRLCEELKVSATEADRHRLMERRSGSFVALQWYDKAWTLATEAKPLAEQENCYRYAINADPRFTPAYDQLASLLENEGKWEEAEKVANGALKIDRTDIYAHKLLAASFWIRGKNEQAEAELKSVTLLDPDDAGAFAHLGYLCLVKGKLCEAIDAFERGAQAEPHGRDAPLIHAQLGYSYAVQGNREMAIAQLQESEPCGPSGNILAERFLAEAYIVLKEFPLAVDHCENFIRLAKERGECAEEVKIFDTLLKEVGTAHTLNFVSTEPPRDYTEQALITALRQKLSKRELDLIQNPLTGTREMTRWAEDVTASSTNNLQRASKLFDVLVQRVGTEGVVPYSFSLTAREVFAKWNEPDFLMHCEEATFLYIALARSIGLKAYAVNVEEACDGGRSAHVCVAIYDGKKVFLVDPAYAWFGAPHKRFTVLDDVHAVAIYLCMQGDLQRKQIAAKLAPELALVEGRLCRDLINNGQWSEAQKLLPLIERVDSIGAMTAAFQAAIAMHEGQVPLAEKLLHKAISIDPRRCSFHFELGNAYLAEGKRKAARESFENALHCLHTKEQGQLLADAIRQTGDPLATEAPESKQKAGP